MRRGASFIGLRLGLEGRGATDGRHVPRRPCQRSRMAWKLPGLDHLDAHARRSSGPRLCRGRGWLATAGGEHAHACGVSTVRRGRKGARGRERSEGEEAQDLPALWLTGGVGPRRRGGRSRDARSGGPSGPRWGEARLGRFPGLDPLSPKMLFQFSFCLFQFEI